MHIKNIFCILLVFTLLACVCIGASAAAGSSTIVQGEKYTMTGEATGSPGSVQWYLFGPNYFKTGTSSVTDGRYEVSFSKEETKAMDPGQYYLVIQHPMYDKVFNVGPVMTSNGYVIKLNNQGPYTDPSATVLFNVNDRQGSNAVYALEKAIRDQNIDDMLATTELTVISAASDITAPTSIYEGGIYSVSGSTTGHVNDMVTVELIGAGFAPAAKQETMNTEQYRIGSTRIGASGLWTVNIDTTGLNPGEYDVKITVGQLSPVYSSLTVLERQAMPTTEPTPVRTFEPSPVPTETPVPASPGFGIIALLGLGGAVLLSRK
ncbi:MAG TPA: hypothetical protein O0X27_02775 [Methanocorpusculum sp.]|nr:hypothetical protein [Methanocorpusculum sp.]